MLLIKILNQFCTKLEVCGVKVIFAELCVGVVKNIKYFILYNEAN
jgi:hypothetical protein